MEWTKENICNLKSNPNNPRLIKDDKFHKLVQSIKDFPEMLELRPIVVNSEMIVLGGNMRLKAAKEAGLKEVPIIKADSLTIEQQNEFIIKDNVSGGEWDWDILANEWDAGQLDDWGLDVPNYDNDQDFGSDENSSTLNLKYLKFGGLSVQITDEEIEGLTNELNDYIDSNSIAVGFVHKIIQCLKESK